MRIGSLVRQRQLPVHVYKDTECLSACTLIYISGVDRYSFGTIGLHRPFLTGQPHSDGETAASVAAMMAAVKKYVASMGISDRFYELMMNTDPSKMRRYKGDKIESLVPRLDPVYEEIRTARQARAYGVWRDRFHQEPAAIEGDAKMLPHGERHGKYPAFPSLVEHGLVALDLDRSEPVHSAHVMQAVHRVLA